MSGADAGRRNGWLVVDDGGGRWCSAIRTAEIKVLVGVSDSLANNMPRAAVSVCLLFSALLVVSSSSSWATSTRPVPLPPSPSCSPSRGRRRGRNLRDVVSPLADDVAAASRGRDREKQPRWAGNARVGCRDQSPGADRHPEQGARQETARWGENQMDPKPGIQSSRSMPLSRVWGSQRRASWEPGKRIGLRGWRVMRTPSQVGHLKCLPPCRRGSLFFFFVFFWDDGERRGGRSQCSGQSAPKLKICSRQCPPPLPAAAANTVQLSRASRC